MSGPFVITFGHEKGGTGKSTLSVHLTLGLVYRRPDWKIASIDADLRQGTSFHFFSKREKQNYGVPMPYLYKGINESKQDSRHHARIEDFATLTDLVTRTSICDVIVIDSTGYRTFLAESCIKLANLLVTPVSYSRTDLDVLVQIEDSNSIYGPYAETVFEQKKWRSLNRISTSFNWFLVPNRIPLLPSENSVACKKILETIGQRTGSIVGSEIADRSVYREAFLNNLTVFDLPGLSGNRSLSSIKAFETMDRFVDEILEYVENK